MEQILVRRRAICRFLRIGNVFLSLPGAVHSQQKPLTASAVIERIKQHVGVAWQAETVDTFKAGNPDTPVTGTAVTMMATMDVLERAGVRQ